LRSSAFNRDRDATERSRSKTPLDLSDPTVLIENAHAASPATVAPTTGAIPAEVVVGGAPPRRRPGTRAWRALWRSRWMRLAGPLALLVAWQLAVTVGGVSPATLPSPESVASAGWEMLRDGTLSDALLVSLRRVALGLLIGVGAGTALGLIAGLFRVGERVIDPSVHMFRTMPALALVPLFILWFGINETPKVLLVAFAVTFPVYLNLYAGIRNIDQRLVEAGSVFGLSRWGLIRHVVLPGALPSWLVGLRFSLGIAWIVLVASEQINATAGIGYLMTTAQALLQTDVIFVGLLVYSLLGLLSDVIVRLLERWTLRWRRGLETL
jgi:sulfonate transport system permease protein